MSSIDPYEFSTAFLKSFGDDYETFDHKGFLQEVIHLAAGMAPGKSGKLINYVIDQLFFPKKKGDKDSAIWSKMEKNVAKMVKKEVDDAIANVIGEMVAKSMMKKLKNFGNLFRQLGYINNSYEMKMHLLVITNEANNIISEINNIPPEYMLRTAKLLSFLAVSHIAAIMELKALEPHIYRHQSALNNMAILYSDTAADMFHVSMAWRRAMIGAGKGEIHYRDSKAEKDSLLGKDKKTVTMTVYDKYANGTWQYGNGSVAVMKVTPVISVDGGHEEFAATKEEVYKALRAYDEEVKKEWTETWNKALLDTTQSFMNLVDWPGRNRELTGEISNIPGHLVFPKVPSRGDNQSADTLQRIDLFLEQQMDQFHISGPRYVQTYRPPKAGFPGDHHQVYFRADTYDTAMACIYFVVRGDLQRACDLGDGLVQAMNHDPVGGGRIVAASTADKLLDPSLNFTTTIYVPDGGRRDVGNMSWTGIALTRLYHATKTHRYLDAAETIGQWILDNCTKNDNLKGFTGGEDHWGNSYKWRSVEHNTDCVSLFDNLYTLTNNKTWETARESARTLVKGCQQYNMFYCTGTGEQADLNAGVIPTDCQTWVSLAKVDPDGEKNSLDWMLTAVHTTSNGFAGTKFAVAGSEVQNEATAGAAMALWFARHKHKKFESKALEYMDSLTRQVKEANNAIGYGVVATPADEADTGEGLGWKYFNYLHVAASAWTGLALAGKENEMANPFANLSS